ncbi:MAG TPA: hypothetical protein VFR09_01350 [Alphaproteobacteria bacterium]|nr:hypothetical protein [Alphaproteobacteria bacterium]
MPIKDDLISSQLTQAIEDAILLGHIKELDAILDVIESDGGFPDELRYGLQALRYFRAHYGKDGIQEPTEHLQKQKAIIMESSWGAELLEKLRREQKSAARRSA